MTRIKFDELTPSRLSSLLSLDSETQWTQADQAEALRHQLSAALLPDLLATADLDAGELEAFIVKFQGPKTFGAHLTCRTPSLQILGAIKRFARQVSVTPHNPLKEVGGRVLYYAAIAAALVRCNSRISSLGNNGLLTGFKWARVQVGTESLSDLFDLAISTLQLLPKAN